MDPDGVCHDDGELQCKSRSPSCPIDTIDLTNEDNDVVIVSARSAARATVKTELLEKAIMSPLPVLEENPIDSKPERNTEHSETLLLNLLTEYNVRTETSNLSTPSQNEYQAAFDAVIKKQAEIAERQTQGIAYDDRLDDCELWELEENLSRITKVRAKESAYEEHQAKSNSMFVDDDEDDDGDGIDLELQHDENNANAYKEVSEIIDQQQNQATERKKPSRCNTAASPTKVTKRVQTKNPKRRRANSPVMLNIGSLMRNDIVANAAANQGAGEQPTFRTTNKRDALAALIASIPKEHQSTSHGTKASLDKACRQFARKGQGSMTADGNGQWRLKGMHSSLKHFQLLGASWGCEKETGDSAPYGGMIADTPGFGKTIQALTIMVENQPKETARNKITLIVCPRSLCMQWKEEIRKHVKEKVLAPVKIEIPGHRTEGMDDEDIIDQLRAYKVVITTYTEIMRHYPKCQPPCDLTTDSAKDEWWAKYYEEHKGPFLRMKFFRIILDEAQTIKNHESRTSKACRLLQAKYKWVLTGTPLSNSLEELFPYFNFLGVIGAGDFEQFKHNYGKRTNKTAERLDAVLSRVMIRRTGADRLFNAPLVSLPALDHQTIALQFNGVEKAIYSIVHRRFIIKINDWTRAGTINQMKNSIFVMLLRLRQMCAHVLMVSTTIRDLLESEDIEKLWKLIRHYNSIGSAAGTETQTVAVLQRLLVEVGEEKKQAEMKQTPQALFGPGNTIDLTMDSAGFGFRDFLLQLQRDGLWEKIRNRSHCHVCHRIPERPRLSIPCSHLFCDDCLRTLIDSSQEQGMDHCICPECYCEVSGDADMVAMKQIAQQAGSRSRSATPLVSAKKADDDHKWLETPNAYMMSTKVRAVTSMLEQWLRQDPDAKIILFTLFLPMISVFSKVCQHKGWGYQQYTGKMTQDTRTKALKEWKDPRKEHPLLLMSMRAGGLGLNLTEASYVIILDPWWNQPMEDQAFSRMYRIGQTRDCVVRRFVVDDAIEAQFMLPLQKTKAKECDRVVDGRPENKMTTKELVQLFARTQRDPATGEVILEDLEDDPSDDFTMSTDQIVVSDSEAEEVSVRPSRPR